MVQFAKPDYPILTDLVYGSPILFVVILLSCASHNSYSYTQIVAHIRCIHIGGLSWISLKNVCKLIEYHLYALIKVCHQSPKRGRLKVHLVP
jgi:hypothetical protein